MQNLKLMTKNVFAQATTVTVPGSDSSYPYARLYDGDRHDLWRHSATLSFSITAEVVSSASVDFIAIEAHNWAGETVTLDYYDGSWHNTVESWGIGALDTYLRTQLSQKYIGTQFRLNVSLMANPQCAEIHLSEIVLDKHPFEPWPAPFKIPNSVIDYTRTGHRRGIRKGDSKWGCKYNFTLNSTEMAVWDQCMDNTYDGFMPFYIYDHNGTVRFVELAGPPEMPYVIPGSASPSIDTFQKIEFTVQEVL